jgi:hypothetical protein
MTTTTLLKKALAKDKGVIVLPVAEYKRLVTTQVPEYYLTGKAARDLDDLVREGLRDYKLGKTQRIKSLADLDRTTRDA